MNLEFTANTRLAGKVTRVREGDREYLVAPAVSINPDSGVLNGSKGALLYPPEECAQNVEQWDTVPLTLFHPTDPITNEALSANSPGVPERQWIGEIRNSHFDGKLRHTFWFDVAATRNADKRFGTDVYNRLQRCEQRQQCLPLELSTGLYTDNEPRAGVHNGRPYDFIARNYRADHIAVLPGQVGACSVRDGCGVLVNAKDAKGHGSEKRGGRVAKLSQHEEVAIARFHLGGFEGLRTQEYHTDVSTVRSLLKKKLIGSDERGKMILTEKGQAALADMKKRYGDDNLPMFVTKPAENRKQGCGDGG